jgi:hypothetical protein
MYLNPAQLTAAQTYQPLYLEAERKIGVPWALLAALHYRESNFAARTARVGSAMQFDPPLSPERVREYGARYKILDLQDPASDVRTAILCAAAFLQAKVIARGNAPLSPDSTEAECADAAWSYNGRAYGSWQKSPYVSNDPQHGVQMRIVGTVPNLKDPSKRDHINQPDTRPGVLAMMRELRERLTPAPSAPAEANPMDRMLVADADGNFRPPAQPRFVVPWPALIGYSNGQWYVRPASREELENLK